MAWMRARISPHCSGELRADRRQLVGAHDARSQRLALEPLHDEAVAEAVFRLEDPEHLGLGDARVARVLHQQRLGAQPGMAREPRHGDAAGGAAHGEPALAVPLRSDRSR